MHEQHAQNLADVGSPKLAPKRRRRAARLPHLGQVENARTGYRAGADGGHASRLRHRQLLLSAAIDFAFHERGARRL